MSEAFDNRNGWIWMNGTFVPWKEATSHVITQGLHYASSVFEGERAYSGKIFKSEEHTKRLFRSANTLGMDMPFTEKQINNAKDELINNPYLVFVHGTTWPSKQWPQTYWQQLLPWRLKVDDFHSSNLHLIERPNNLFVF